MDISLPPVLTNYKVNVSGGGGGGGRAVGGTGGVSGSDSSSIGSFNRIEEFSQTCPDKVGELRAYLFMLIKFNFLLFKIKMI